MKINHNIPALRTLNQLNKANDKTASAIERLSSGLRINKAADDAAGLAIANKMDAQIKGLQQANRNAMDGISLIQTAEGGLNEVHAILQRMRELSVQAANGSNSDEDRKHIQAEIDQLIEEVDRIARDTEFNGKRLLSPKPILDENGHPVLDGEGNPTFEEMEDIIFQIGANGGQTVTLSLGDMSAEALGIHDLNLETEESAQEAIATLDNAINLVSSQRSTFGAIQNRLEHTVNNLGESEENLTASLSRIQDADMAAEMANFTQQNVLSQAATAMLAQANQRPQQVLQLLN